MLINRFKYIESRQKLLLSQLIYTVSRHIHKKTVL